jgi:hypothetical protein
MSLKRFDEFTKSESNNSDNIVKKTTIKDLKKETKNTEPIPPLLKKTKRVNENSFLVGQDYKVKVVIDVPQSLVQEYIDKVKEETDKDPLDNFSEAEIAEQIISFLVKKNLFIDNLSPEFTVGSEDLGSDEKSNSALGADAESLTDDLGIENDESEDGEIEFKNFNKNEDDKNVSDVDLESDGEIEINSDKTKTKELGETIEVDKTKNEKPKFDEIEFENGDEEDKINNSRPKTIGDLKKANGEAIEKSNKKENSETVKEEEEEIEDMYAKIGYKIGYNEQYANMYRAILKK